MFILDTINEKIGEAANSLNIIWLLLGAALIILAVYMKIKDIKFKKYGKVIQAKVKAVDVVKKEFSGNRVATSYKTTFEFDYEGKKIEKTIATTKKFKVGVTKKGMYLDDGKDGLLSISTEGFYLSKGGEIILLLFGAAFFIVGLYSFFDISLKFVIYLVVALFILVLGYFFIFPLLVKNPKTEKEKAYYNLEGDENSSVDKTLIRYIPEYTSKPRKSNKIKVSTICFTIILLLISIPLLIIGIRDTKHDLNIKFNFPSEKATIIEIYKYKKNNNNEVEYTGVKYSYNVNGKEYQIDTKTDKKSGSVSYKKGDKIKLYYDKNDPNKTYLKNELNSGLVPMVVSLLFIFYAIFAVINDKSKAKQYSQYVLRKDK